MIVGVDTETTGLDPKTADIVQVAIVAFKDNLEPEREIPPFFLNMKPAKYKPGPEYLAQIEPAMRVNKLSLADLMENAFDPIKAAELFDEFWERLGGEKLYVIGHNWPFDRGFLIEWLGKESFEQFFSHYYRDTYCASLFLNDLCDSQNYERQFKEGHSLYRLCKALNVENPQAHNALEDILATVKCYRKMLEFVPVAKEIYKRII